MEQLDAPEPIGPQAPTPDGYTPDPFAPDPTIFPPPPPWLFPATMVLLAIATVVVLILLYGWWKSIQLSKAERASQPTKDWVDLSQLNKKGRWRDETDQPRPHEPDDDEDDDGLEKSGGGPRN